MDNFISFKKREAHSGRPENPISGTFYWMNDGSFWFSPVDGECRRLDTDEDIVNGLKELIDNKVGSSDFEKYKNEVQILLDSISDLTSNSDFDDLRNGIYDLKTRMDVLEEILSSDFDIEDLQEIKDDINNLDEKVESIQVKFKWRRM